METNPKTGFRTIEVYPVYFTKQELEDLENVLYDKSSMLNLISHKLEAQNKHTDSLKANNRSIYYEKLAGKIGLPLDDIYKNQYATAKNNKKENA